MFRTLGFRWTAGIPGAVLFFAKSGLTFLFLEMIERSRLLLKSY